MNARPGRYDDIDTIRQKLWDLRDQLPHLVVYDHPDDQPDHYIARLWTTRPELACHDFMFGFTDIDRLRQYMELLGLTHLARSPADPPHIMETWL